MARGFGVNDWIASDDTAIAWGIGTGNCTYGAWVWTDDQSSTYRAPLGFGAQFSNPIPMLCTRSTSDVFSCFWNGTGLMDFDTTLSTGQWYHLIQRRTGTGSGGFQGFVDGVQEATTHTCGTAFSTAQWAIGAGADDNNFDFMGRVAEAAVWDTDLTDEEIAALASGFAPSMVRPSGLVGYLPLVRDRDHDLTGVGDFDPAGSPTIEVHPRIIYPPPKRTVYPVPSAAPADPAFNQYARKHTNVLLRR